MTSIFSFKEHEKVFEKFSSDEKDHNQEDINQQNNKENEELFYLVDNKKCSVKKYSRQEIEKNLSKISNSNNPNPEKLLGIHWGYNYKEECYQSHYYIGLGWLEEKSNKAIQINPKMENLDFLKIFMDCFNEPKILKELNQKRGKDKKAEEIYKIFFDQKQIKTDSMDFEITPFLILHYLKVLENLVKKGLKKDYIRREENLNSKIKGKIIFSKHIKKNEMMSRQDRVYCNYQDYSVDCLENRFLKKALIFANHYLQKNYNEKFENESNEEGQRNLKNTTHFCLSAFREVSDIPQTKVLKQFKINRLYRDYGEALKLAKMILQRFSYNLQETEEKSEKQNFFPFYINMPLLFEIYVYHQLKKKYKDDIDYQFDEGYGEIDFLKKSKNEKIIIDAKYKNAYMKKSENEKNSKEEQSEEAKLNKKYNIEDIRQLSGYARDKRVLKKLYREDLINENLENNNLSDQDREYPIPACLIIYPYKKNANEGDNQNSIEKNSIEKLVGENLLSKENLEGNKNLNDIDNFAKFYKLGIKLPIKNE